MIDADRLLVVGQQVRGHPAEGAETAVQRGEHARGGLVQNRDDHPGPRPRQPGAQQDRLHPGHQRTVTEVVLGPHARLGHPRPVHPHLASPVVLLHLRDRPPRRALRTLVAQRQQLAVCDVRADLAPRALDPLLNLGQERVDQLRPRRSLLDHPAGITLFHIPGHRVVRAPGQLSSITKRPSQVVRIQNFHDLLGRLQLVSLLGGDGTSAPPAHLRRGLNRGMRRGKQFVSSRTRDRQRAVFMTATGQLNGRPRAVCRGRQQLVPALQVGKSPVGARGGRWPVGGGQAGVGEGVGQAVQALAQGQ